jgi:hypothetical protein
MVRTSSAIFKFLIYYFVLFQSVILTGADSTEPQFCDAETCPDLKQRVTYAWTNHAKD